MSTPESGSCLMIAACGDSCDACPRRVATLSGDPRRLAEVAALWHRLGWREAVVSADEICCQGCSATHPCVHGIAACATERRVATCGDCAAYPSCERIAAALARTDVVARSCRDLCDDRVYEALSLAFFGKRENLDRRRRERQAKAAP